MRQRCLLEITTVVGHRVGIPPPLISFFHDLNGQVKPFSMLFTYIIESGRKAILVIKELKILNLRFGNSKIHQFAVKSNSTKNQLK